MNDPRVEAAAKAITTRYGDPVRRWKQDIDDAIVALTAADQADREQGIHRVRVDDATVERVARVLQVKSYDMRIPWDDYKRVARAVLAALTGAGS